LPRSNDAGSLKGVKCGYGPQPHRVDAGGPNSSSILSP
jgi:hypothetical protein